MTTGSGGRCALLIAIAALLIAFALRVHELGAQSLWHDEGNSYVQSTRTFSEIAYHAGLDIHPPAYYWALAVWRLLTGESEFALRALSLFASLLSVAFLFALARRLFDAWTAGAAAVFAALNTFSIFYAQEARMYALLALWGAAAMWALERLVHRPTPRHALILGAINAAGLWTQYSFPFVMLAQGVQVLVAAGSFARRRDGRAAARLIGLYAGANALALAIFAPWLPTALRQITTWPTTGDLTPPAEALATISAWLTLGLTAPAGLPPLAAIALLFGVLHLDRRPLGLWRMLVPVVFTVLPVVCFLALGLFRASNLKFLLPAQLAAALWLAQGLRAIWRLQPRSSALAFAPRAVSVGIGLWMIVALWGGIPSLYGDTAFRRADYRAIVRTIESELRAGDAIVLDAPNQEEVFRYYYRDDLAPIYPLPPGLGGDDAETQAAVRGVIARHERVFAVFWGEAERDPNRIVERTLDQEAFEAGDTWYGDVRLARYVMPQPLTTVRASDALFTAENGDAIRLERYALSEMEITAGSALQAQFDWRTDAPLERRYKVFIQLLDANGALAAQRDSEPGGGLALTNTWMPGEVLRDNHGLMVPHDLAVGTYTLIVGWYDLEDPSARLRLTDGSDAFILGMVTVE